ncbi:MAG: class II glutamine amidotransferase [Clostridiales bacterium]|nr:class II glutamine amidotransferase [Clostridiales bacterium]
MCELFGISARTPVDVREYLKTFFSHSPLHPHGWGLMRQSSKKTDIIKEPVCASCSAILDDVIESTLPQTALLAHIRLATVGAAKYTNCHPYTGFDASGRHWTLIHNGTIYSGMQLSKYLSEQSGDTDSERIFLYLLDEINKTIILNNAPLSEKQRCSIINKLAVTLSPRNKLNFMIYDGEVLYVHKNMKNTLVYKELNDGVVFSTQPLDSEGWLQLPMTRLLAFKNGAMIFKGKDHKNEFIPTLEYITTLDAMNI